MVRKGRSLEYGSYLHYGNAADYLARRIACDRPDILQGMKRDEYRSVRQAAIAAGIIDVPADEDKALIRLCAAWRKADLEDRRLFLALMDEEIEAAVNGHYLNEPKRRGPRPSMPADSSVIPELEALIDAGSTVSSVARQLGVSYRTVCRWRSGQSSPSAAKRQVLVNMAEHITTEPPTGDEKDDGYVEL